MNNHRVTVALVLGAIAPYHAARIQSAGSVFRSQGSSLLLVERQSSQKEYPWFGNRQPEGVQFHRAYSPRQTGQTRATVSAMQLFSVLNRLQPDIVAFGLPSAAYLGALAWCKLKRKSVILFSESKLDDKIRYRGLEWLKERLVRQFDAAVVGGSPHIEYVAKLGIPKERVFAGYDAVDNDYFSQAADKMRQQATDRRYDLGLPKYFFLTCARFVQKKNLDGLLKAYALYRTSQEYPWDLVIAGSGELESELHRLSDSMQLEGVHWPGFVQYSDLPKYYGLASAFVMPSTTEQWGLVVNEAMASGLPVLVSQTAGCRYDLVEDKRNGYLFDPFNINDIARAMSEMTAISANEREKMGQRSREIIAHWGPERFAEGLWRAVESVRG